MKKEIGGYFELECGYNAPYHKNGLLFNSARNALRHFIRCLKITEIFVPVYTCPVVFAALKKEWCKIIFYNIDDNFMPIENLPSDSWMLYNNYFGICEKNAMELEKRFPKLILDNAQAFYAPLRGTASIYSPRKFFGLPDGGILLSKQPLSPPERQDVSFNRCRHLLKRHDLTADAGFADFRENNDKLKNIPILQMSRLTQNLMGNINYKKIKQKRLENFNYLHNALSSKNKLKIFLEENEVPMAYPFLTEQKNLREHLINNKVYVAKYWTGAEHKFSENLLSLPIDQRYSVLDMERIVKLLEERKK